MVGCFSGLFDDDRLYNVGQQTIPESINNSKTQKTKDRNQNLLMRWSVEKESLESQITLTALLVH